MFISLTCSHLF